MRALATLLLPVLLLSACGGSGGSDVDPAPFRAALEADFQKRKYGVTIDSVESVTVDGKTARAIIRVAFKEGTGMKPKWTVHFKQDGDAWAVEKIDKK